MSLNTQVPFLYTVLGASSQTLTITNARSVSVLTAGGITSVQNSATQTILLPLGATIELNSDSGNTLSTITITPQAAATAYVVMISGVGIVTP
jgi:hypothetical protein